jgi:hypothetical protein
MGMSGGLPAETSKVRRIDSLTSDAATKNTESLLFGLANAPVELLRGWQWQEDFGPRPSN